MTSLWFVKLRQESPPKLTWEREGVPFPAGRTVIQGGKLVITAIKKDDYGVYTCIATSDDGEAKHSTTIAVICKLNELLEAISTTEIMSMLSELWYLTYLFLLYFFIHSFQPLLASPQLQVCTLTVQQL